MQKWEYLYDDCEADRGLRPKYINHQEQRNWKNGPFLAEYINRLGAEGWELVSFVRVANILNLELIFKRQKSE